ncbi:AMP-binding protein [Methanobrevibacter sp.]|uniref:AMP-binding protein n=1 Tax=Methanobrevibacter sp. TaxID=66852 RepID=UPI0025CCD230|nr:AMP-binding protein [Methanobrevibacter sp.]
MDGDFAPQKLNYIRQNSDSKYIITYDDIENAINPEDLINEGDSSFPKVNLKKDSPIFLLYTSGSIGKPKRVISTHCGISNLISVHIKTNYKKILSISSISFDISEEDILITMTNDMELIFANDDEIMDTVLLARLIEDTEPEFVNITPSRLLSYLQVPEFHRTVNTFIGIGCGGEQFTKNLYESIKKHADVLIYNGYGPLETSLTSNSKLIRNLNFITNGKPLLNFITDVRDIDRKLLPYGVIGELYIGGVGVSKGYYKMDERQKKYSSQLMASDITNQEIIH